MISGYRVPDWHAPPSEAFGFEVIKGGCSMPRVDLNAAACAQSAEAASFVLIGRDADACGLALSHPSVSRVHAVLQFRSDSLLLRDLGSTHGTQRNKASVASVNGGAGEWVELAVGDILRFGASSRLYVLEGPDKFRPNEIESERLRLLRQRAERHSEKRLRDLSSANGARADGDDDGNVYASWGMNDDGDDATEQVNARGVSSGALVAEEEEGAALPEYLRDMVSDPTAPYTLARLGLARDESKLKPADRKSWEKIQRVDVKLAHLRTEVARIRAKEGRQGELTGGQRSQVEKNERAIEVHAAKVSDLVDAIKLRRVGASSAAGGLNAKEKQLSAAERRRRRRRAVHGDDDDDFFDRTESTRSKRARGASTASNAPAQAALVGETRLTLAALQEQACVNAKERRILEAELARAREDSAAGAALEIEEGTDVLDAYLVDATRTQIAATIQALERRIAAAIREEERVTALVDIATPALSRVTRAAPAPAPDLAAEPVTALAALAPRSAVVVAPPAPTSSPLPPPAAREQRASLPVPAPAPSVAAPPVPPAIAVAAHPRAVGGQRLPVAEGSVDVAIEPIAPAVVQPATKRVLGPSLPSMPTKRRRKRSKRGATERDRSGRDSGGSAVKLKTLEGGDIAWVAPVGQRGDGVTSLNAKFGY